MFTVYAVWLRFKIVLLIPYVLVCHLKWIYFTFWRRILMQFKFIFIFTNSNLQKTSTSGTLKTPYAHSHCNKTLFFHQGIMKTQCSGLSCFCFPGQDSVKVHMKEWQGRRYRQKVLEFNSLFSYSTELYLFSNISWNSALLHCSIRHFQIRKMTKGK